MCVCVCAHVEKILARLNVRVFNGMESKRLLSAERSSPYGGRTLKWYDLWRS